MLTAFIIATLYLAIGAYISLYVEDDVRLSLAERSTVVVLWLPMAVWLGIKSMTGMP